METCVYGAYGDRVALTADVPRTAYAGYVHEADLPWYVLGQRIYIPWLRRFIGVDALSPFGEGGLNRYTYCVGDPINQIDPSGQASWKWLGDLLGRIGGAIGKGMDMVSQVTPTTALTRIGAVADVVAVGTTIGAVAAGALGDESTAGILGWVAAGSALSGLGLGSAGHFIAKGTSRPGSESQSRSERTWAPHGRTLKGGVTMTPHTVNRGGQSVGKVHVYQGGDLAKLPELKSRLTNTGEVSPVLHSYPGMNGGVNYFTDTPMTKSLFVDYLDMIADDLMQEPLARRKLIILGGVHGSSTGESWVKRANTYTRIGADSLNFDDQFKKLLKNPPDFNFELHDIAGITSSDFKKFVDSDAYVFHAYCFGAADRKLVKYLGLNYPRESFYTNV